MRPAYVVLALSLAAAAAPARSAPGAGAPRLAFPVACVIGKTCEVQNYVDRDPGPGAKDYRCGTSTYQAHNGVDIRIADMAAQRAGVNVLAAAPGKVTRLRDGVDDVSVRVAGAASVANQECGNGVVIDHGGGWETQYCHLAKGSLKVKAGDLVNTGQAIARIGLSGNTEYPHVHMTVRHGGEIVDPSAPNLAPGACDGKATGQGLWTPAAAAAMAYRSGVVLNSGFAGAVVTMEAVEAGGVAPPRPDSPYLVAYVRAIDLAQGDVQVIALKGPDGQVLAQARQAPLDHSKAQWLTLVGKKRPAAGWAKGVYVAAYSVERGGRTVISRSFQIGL